ncbi:uncharacterized protein LOC134213038 isoform X2 [Armigeres subalbatus]|uniref:uncharacterized protein LOC134213038 isoform X2 n=1 Tax=Armigeres subalbatus TaxID=124917 RepID=UPI002ED60066
MSNDSYDDIEEELSSWGYSRSFSDYERSLVDVEESPGMLKISMPRGRGITDDNYINNVKLASEINGIKDYVIPLGHLPTTREVLNEENVNEITPLLRQLGISGHDGAISSKNTRAISTIKKDIRVEGNLPIILNSDLFAMINEDDVKGSSESDEEPYDPERPLHEQFSTIKEFVINHEKMPSKDSSCSSASHNTRSSISITLSSYSTPAIDGSSSCSSNLSTTTFSVSEQDSNDEIFEPLIKLKEQLYTPRQLYEYKRKISLQKGKESRLQIF